MTIISFDEPIHFDRNHFRNLEDFHLYIIQNLESADLSSTHKSILDERLEEAENNPDNFISFDELKSSIKRKKYLSDKSG